MDLWSPVRWVRAASFAAACAVLAAGSHVAAGGRLDRSAVGIGFLVMLALALVATRRERTIATILPTVAAAQAVLHFALSQSGTGHSAAVPAAEASTAMSMPMPEPHDGSGGLAMLLMHAVAVLVTSWWLECGEARLCALVRRLARWTLRAFARLRPAPVYGPARPIRARRRLQAPVDAVILRYAMVRRGPPGSMAAHG
ncbi:hypothetical protein BZB76_2074 [Actinomadura pelletieri DSM 43383]|uniref:Uncharacterized protein n=1 Tax=Actinomadura pelletieri DSM 43383 TaxID=1120940 RepID=A0A495QT78_9ACTN|nr:MFS transporter [Actinomadura pelletieri]RKS76716.1 hypothetical protein BZB76_2074 [Actinomadura pelletieri DSM 43383]